MAIHDVEKFYIKIEKDKNLQNVIKNIDAKETGKIKNSKDVIEFIKNEIVPLGKTLGFNFNAQELLIYETKILKLRYKYINDDSLNDVNGGKSNSSPKSLSSLLKKFNLDANHENQW